VIGALRGQEPPAIAHELPARSLHLPQHESSQYRFCTNFAVSGEGLEASTFVPKLEDIGDSVLVVGDDKTLRVHVHTDEPDSAAALFEGVGEVSRFDVADMREQIAERRLRIAGNGNVPASTERGTCGVVAVASGEGMKHLYEDLGAQVVDGGATLNPSTYELLAGIHAVEADEVIVLPNSQNVILAAERAAELSERPARVVPTRAQQTGLAALLAFDPGRTSEENAGAVGAAAEALRTGGIAQAARDDAQGRFKEGDALGYAGEDLVAWGDLREVLPNTIAAVAEGCEVLTCIAGEGAPLDAAEVEGALPEGVELDWQQGDQPAWWYLLAAE
jgi:dihydroxyacetone kinase-like predicted kinase